MHRPWQYLLSLCLCVQCQPQASRLPGDWVAVAYTSTADSSAALPADTLRLRFFTDGRYAFDGAAYYRENGRFRCSWRYLFLTDTLHDPQRAYTLRLERLEQDTLVLYMERNSVGERLVFARE